MPADPVWEIRRIRAKRYRNVRTEYLIDWEPSWEDEDSFVEASKALAEFNASGRGRVSGTGRPQRRDGRFTEQTELSATDA